MLVVPAPVTSRKLVDWLISERLLKLNGFLISFSNVRCSSTTILKNSWSFSFLMDKKSYLSFLNRANLNLSLWHASVTCFLIVIAGICQLCFRQQNTSDRKKTKIKWKQAFRNHQPARHCPYRITVPDHHTSAVIKRGYREPNTNYSVVLVWRLVQLHSDFNIAFCRELGIGWLERGL